MVGQFSLDWLWQLTDMIRNHVPLDALPNGNMIAWVAIVVGLLLGLWGVRLLRMVFVLILLSIGAAIGSKLALRSQMEPLPGLVLGGAIGGFFGHLFYRWWLMIMSGVCAMLFVVAVGGARVLPAEVQGYHDHLCGMDTGNYATALANHERHGQRPVQAAQEYLKGFCRYAWEQRSDLVRRWLIALVLAGLLGFAAGLLLPRFTTTVGTSVIGVLMWVSGGCWLISQYAPAVWASIRIHSGWLLTFTALALVVSISVQLRGGKKLVVLAPVEPSPAPTVPAGK